MKRYTLDASGLLRYFVDALPAGADQIVRRAFDGKVVIEIPAIAAAEAMYIAYNRETIAGRPFRGSPEDVIVLFRGDVPMVLAPTDLDILTEVLDWQSTFSRQLHDAMVVASHIVNDTEAVITSDAKLDEYVTTVWQ